MVGKFTMPNFQHINISPQYLTHYSSLHQLNFKATMKVKYFFITSYHVHSETSLHSDTLIIHCIIWPSLLAQLLVWHHCRVPFFKGADFVNRARKEVYWNWFHKTTVVVPSATLYNIHKYVCTTCWATQRYDGWGKILCRFCS